MKKKQIIGIVIFIVLIITIVLIKTIKDNSSKLGDLTTVYVATGGGKEDFIADEDVVKTMQEN